MDIVYEYSVKCAYNFTVYRSMVLLGHFVKQLRIFLETQNFHWFGLEETKNIQDNIIMSYIIKIRHSDCLKMDENVKIFEKID